jgi:hypothetical protein
MTSKSTTTSKKLYKVFAQPWKPHPYMKKGVKWLLEHAAAGLFLDPGLGKTSISLAAFCFLLKRGVARKALVIAPIRAVYDVWPAEVKKWLDFNHLRLAILHGPHKEEALASDADIYVINPEGIPWLLQGGPRAWRALGFDTLIIDELSKWKNSQGVRFKQFKHYLDTFDRRWGLTGSPAANGLLDLFGQMYMLDLGRSLGRYITHYRTAFFTNPDKMGWKWVPMAGGAKEAIYERIKPVALRMEDKDYLDLPEIVPLWVPLTLPAKVRKIYDALEDDLIAQIESGVVVAANAAAAGTKLWQICNGGLYVDDDIATKITGRTARTTLHLHNVKTDWLSELVDELQGEPLLVCYQFDQDLDRLLARFPDTPVFGANRTLNTQIQNEWNDNELPLVFGQQDSIAHALNLQGGSACHIAHYSLTWNLETFDQVLRRIRRQGNTSARVFQHLPFMVGTTDEDRRFALRHKASGQKALLDALKKRRGVK